MDMLTPIAGFLLITATLTAWLLYALEGYRGAKKWAIILTWVSFALFFFLIYSWNVKGCNEYHIDDYQSGDVPVECIGTYNTVPARKSLYD